MSKSTKKTVQTGQNEPFFEIAQDSDGQWHWILWSGNGRKMARNAEEYQKRKDVLQAVKNLHRLVPAVKKIAYGGPQVNGQEDE